MARSRALRLGAGEVEMAESKKAARAEKGERFTKEERAAMRERAREAKAARSGAEGEADVLAAIAKMPDADRVLGERLHALIRQHAPELAPRTWYGMPAYARDGKVVCFFQNASKFKTRYATLGFSDRANLDDGSMWPVAFALEKLTKADEKRIIGLLKQALG
jgi:uncharacterized protein YdhG (YjbR/CyaY superfamily)